MITLCERVFRGRWTLLYHATFSSVLTAPPCVLTMVGIRFHKRNRNGNLSLAKREVLQSRQMPENFVRPSHILCRDLLLLPYMGT